MAEGVDNINGEEEMSAGGNILGDIGKFEMSFVNYLHTVLLADTAFLAGTAFLR
jgi:hypothetical protein